MKSTIPIATAFLLTLWLAAPSSALDGVPTTEQVLQACANDQMSALPMPFSDVPANHWAFDAVMKMYYCGPMRGQFAADELRRLQQGSAQIGDIASLPAVNELLAAPETVEIDGRQYVLETYLWRDFMPISDRNGKPLMASIRVTAKDKQTFPTSLKVDRLWAIAGDRDVWETNLEGDAQQPRANQLEKVARNGPKWEPGTSVDVVVRLIDQQNRTYLLKAPQQSISRTD